MPNHELVCFGDLLKIPGTDRTLSDAKSAGGQVRMVWSPFDSIEFAKQNPETTFVIAAIGFETTAPAFALLLEEARGQGLSNIRLLTSLKSALSAIDWICAAGEDIDAFLCPGHVSVITGANAYIPLAEKYGKPFIVAGFEPEHLVSAIRAAVEDAAEGQSGVRNYYTEAVSDFGNQKAKDIIGRYFDLGDAVWRGLGTVAGSGYCLKAKWRGASIEGTATDGGTSFEGTATGVGAATVPEGCCCEAVILGRIDPDECPLFGTACTPLQAVGPCMVSAEGACGTWYRSRV